MKYWDTKVLEQLTKVQEIDLKIRKLENAIDALYQRSKEEDPLLTQLQQSLVLTEEDIKTTETQHQMYVNTLEDIRAAIKNFAITKSGAPKPRTRSSTEALKIEEEKLSKMLVETEEQTKQLCNRRAALISQIAERTKDVEGFQLGPEAEIRNLRVKIKRLETIRATEVEGISPMLLRKYDRLKSSRSGIGLTVLRDGVCMVCRMQLPTAIVSKMNNNEQIPDCPACGRMVARVEITGPLQVRSPVLDDDSSDSSRSDDEDENTDNEMKEPEAQPIESVTKIEKKETKKARPPGKKEVAKKITAKKTEPTAKKPKPSVKKKNTSKPKVLKKDSIVKKKIEKKKSAPKKGPVQKKKVVQKKGPVQKTKSAAKKPVAKGKKPPKKKA